MNNSKIAIRSITYTIDLNRIQGASYLSFVATNIKKIKEKFRSQNIDIRTIRFNIIALENLDDFNKNTFFTILKKLSTFSSDLGLRWFNISFNLIDQSTTTVDLMCDISLKILKKFENSFINLIVAKSYINNYAVLKSADLIKQVSTLSLSGIDNFRVGISLNIEANTPFFPFSYSNSNDSFSIAIESTQKVLDIIENDFTGDYVSLKERIILGMSHDLLLIEAMAKEIVVECDIKYHGQDISLSPYPNEDISVIEILNLLGLDNFGSNGTQFLTAYLTSILKEILKKLEIKAIGFNGVMYSLLEDKLMCKSHNEKKFSIDSIILYSTVCGCGLDMVPLPGDVLREEVASMILDVATTSIKLNKPLGVRVLPIMNKVKDDFTELKLDFLTNTRIPEVKHIHIDKSIFKINKFFVKA